MVKRTAEARLRTANFIHKQYLTHLTFTFFTPSFRPSSFTLSARDIVTCTFLFITHSYRNTSDYILKHIYTMFPDYNMEEKVPTCLINNYILCIAGLYLISDKTVSNSAMTRSILEQWLLGSSNRSKGVLWSTELWWLLLLLLHHVGLIPIGAHASS